jgi:hypothetical protein
MNSVRKTGGKNNELEVLTKGREIYLHKNRSDFSIDSFNSKIASNDEAYEGSTEFQDIESLITDLRKLDVSDSQIVEIKKLWNLL